MKYSVKIIIVSLITVLCIAIGYLASGLVRDSLNSAPNTPVYSPGPSGARTAPAGNGRSTGGATVSAPAPALEPESESESESALATSSDVAVAFAEPEITGITAPVYDEKTKHYSFTVSATGSNLKYILCRSNGAKLRTQDNGNFVVDALEYGSYSVYVSDTVTGKDSEKETVSGCLKIFNRLTHADIQNAFNSGDYQQGDRLDFGHCLRGCKFKFEGLNASEEAPGSYSEIFNRIGLGTWRSVRVSSVVYDSQNRVKSMSITIIY